MREKKGRRMDRRRVRARRRSLNIGGRTVPGLVVEVEGFAAFLTPDAAYTLADRLVDLAERAETVMPAARNRQDVA